MPVEFTCPACEDGYKPVLNGICENPSCEFSKEVSEVNKKDVLKGSDRE